MNNDKTRIAKLNWEIVQRDAVIEEQGKEIDRRKKTETFLWGYLAVFSAIVALYFVWSVFGG